jgi:hypothetical protein
MLSALSKDKRTAASRPQLEHRHFAVVAATIREMQPDSWRRSTAHHFANSFKRTNTKFDYRRFLAACGVDDD